MVTTEWWSDPPSPITVPAPEPEPVWSPVVVINPTPPAPEPSGEGRIDPDCDHEEVVCLYCGGYTDNECDHVFDCPSCESCEYEHTCQDCSLEPSCDHCWRCPECRGTSYDADDFS